MVTMSAFDSSGHAPWLWRLQRYRNIGIFKMRKAVNHVPRLKIVCIVDIKGLRFNYKSRSIPTVFKIALSL